MIAYLSAVAHSHVASGACDIVLAAGGDKVGESGDSQTILNKIWDPTYERQLPLGTITGMISSFGIMSEAGLGQPHAVTGGVAEALIATAAGLLIAILTLIPYNYFSNRAERELEEIEYYGSRLELLLTEQEGKG